MDKKSKDALRRYAKARQHAETSSSSSSSSYSSSASDSDSSGGRKAAAERHRKKKARQTARRSSSSTDHERKRERDHSQRKLEAKRNHLKRMLKEAKLKKRAAAAAAALSGHSHRALSPTTQAKLKKLAERKHQRAASKERREREKEKQRATAAASAARELHERGAHRCALGSRSPNKVTKIRIHQDVKRQKSSPPHMHHQLMSREKIIIQTRTRDRTPPQPSRHHDELVRDRDRKERDRERIEREAVRDKERAEALVRCQERQRDRERLVREKVRRDDDGDKYVMADHTDRLLPIRSSDRDLGAASRSYTSRERDSLERSMDRPRIATNKHDMDHFGRERDFIDVDRRALLDREEARREREYLAMRRRDLSPLTDRYSAGRLRDPRDLYHNSERDRVYNRGYIEGDRHIHEIDSWMEARELRDRSGLLKERHDQREYHDMKRDLLFIGEHDRDRMLRDREPRAGPQSSAVCGSMDWENNWDAAGRDRDWHDTAPVPGSGSGGFVGGPKHGVLPTESSMVREQRSPSEPDWDAHELKETTAPIVSVNKAVDLGPRENAVYNGVVSGNRDLAVPPREKHTDRRWTTNDWHEDDDTTGRSNATLTTTQLSHHRGTGRGFRRGGDHSDRISSSSLRPHPPPLMTLPVHPPGGYHNPGPRFPLKRNMTYTNPNLLKNKQVALTAAKTAVQASAVVAATTAVAAAKAAAQSAANATTNPSILGQVGSGSLRPSSELDNEPIVESIATIDTTFEAIGSKTATVGDDLSEISDSDDDILTSTDPKLGTVEDNDGGIIEEFANSVLEKQVALGENAAMENTTSNLGYRADEDMLDFEEISDGELEEDTKAKTAGVGDALGVDWTSLMAETSRHGSDVRPKNGLPATTLKQRWQAHRIFLNVGVSIKMGAEYGLRLLEDVNQKVAFEDALTIKSDVKTENESSAVEDVNAISVKADIKIENVKSINEQMISVNNQQKMKIDADANEGVRNLTSTVNSMAFVQVGERKKKGELQELFTCGPYSRALCAQRDLALRRRLLGHAIEDNFTSKDVPPVSTKIKQRAIDLFQRCLTVQ